VRGAGAGAGHARKKEKQGLRLAFKQTFFAFFAGFL
jgi:hypothetical protein